MLRPAAALTILLIAGPVFAQAPPDTPSGTPPVFDGCFARTYDAAHLAAHVGQTVSAMKLQLKPRAMDDGYNVSAELRFAFRDDKRAFYAVGICKDTDGILTCGFDQDAGQITVKPAAGGMQVTPISDVRADADTGDEADYVTIKQSNPEDRVFALHAVAASQCKEFATEE
jgi:hypothetical protein